MLRTLVRSAQAGLAALTLTAGAAAAQTELTYSSWIPWSHPVNQEIYIPWMEAIEEESEGRITFRRLPKPVASPPAHLDAVRTGQADVAFTVHGYQRARYAAYLFAELPFLGDSAELTSVALQRTHEEFLADKEDSLYPGVHLVGMNMHGPGVVHHTSTPILSPSDMEGQKMRTGGPIPLAIVEGWGGVSIRQPAPKSYEILSAGIADGILFPFESIPSFNLTELIEHSTTMPGGWYSSSHSRGSPAPAGTGSTRRGSRRCRRRASRSTRPRPSWSPRSRTSTRASPRTTTPAPRPRAWTAKRCWSSSGSR
jgi:TRAP-type C4-dicarboxylate transport system substrate-binding protein